MTEKDLIKQLKNLQETKAETNWKGSLRRFLLQKTAETKETTPEKKEPWLGVFSDKFFQISHFLNLGRLRFVPRPVMALGAIVLVLVGGIFTVSAAEDATPGSPLYFARIVKEKAQLAATLDQEDKTRLGIKFASNHARDISAVLDSEEFRNNPNQKDLDRLSQNFEENIESVKIRLQAIKEKEDKTSEEVSETEPESDTPEEKDSSTEIATLDDASQTGTQEQQERDDSSEEAEESQDQEATETEESFFSVDSSRDEEGIQVHTQDRQPDTSTEEASKTEQEKMDDQVSQELEKAEEIMDQRDYDKDRLSQLITRAEELFAQGKYDQVRQVLDEFMIEIENQKNSSQEQEEEESSGEVKGVSEKATSTDQEQEDVATSTATSTEESQEE